MERLFPDVYPEDPEEAAEFRRLTQDDLKQAKLEQARTVLSDLLEAGGEVHLDEEAADLWLRPSHRRTAGAGYPPRCDRRHGHRSEELDEAVLRDPHRPRVAQLGRCTPI